MKINLFILGILMSFSLVAQEPNIPLDDQIDSIIAPLDLSDITSGLWLNRGFTMMDPERFDGTSNADTIKEYGDWFRLFGTMVTSKTGATSPIGVTSDYKPSADALLKSNVLPIMVLHAEYHKVKADSALLSSLIYYSNGQYHDYPNQSTSPYEEDEVLSFSPKQNELVDELTCDFQINSEFIRTNTGKTISTLEIDFDNGSGYQNIAIGTSKRISWATYGDKVFKLKITYTDASVYYAHSLFSVISSNGGQPKYNGTPDETKYIAHPDPNMSDHGATLSIAYGCGNTELRKPFIFVEGFNPEQFVDLKYYHDFLQRFEFYQEQWPASFPALTEMQENGYDVVYVDFDQGAGSIIENAKTVQEVIKWVNREKAENSSTSPNILAGFSMGGIVGRLALCYMEAENLEPHDVDYYISMDSPHLGANVPRSIIAALRDIYGLSFGDFSVSVDIPMVESAFQVLNSPAAKQMLIYSGEGSNSLVTGHGPTYVNFQAHLNSQGLPDADGVYNGMPKHTIQNIAISKGNGNGTGQGFGSMQKILEVDIGIVNLINCVTDAPGVVGWIAGATAFASLGSSIKVELYMKAMPGYTSTPHKIYDRKIGLPAVFWPLGIPYVSWSYHSTYAQNVYSFDGVQGGNMGVERYATEEGGSAFLQKLIDGEYEPCLKLHHQNFCFIPTVSALNLPSLFYTPTAVIDTEDIVGNEITSFTKAFIVDPTQYPSGTTAPSNEGHSDLTPSNIFPFSNVFGYDYDEINQSSTLTGSIFNFGQDNLSINPDVILTTDRITTQITISGTSGNEGAIWVNRDERLADITNTANPYSNIDHFGIELTKDCSGNPGRLMINQNGSLVIGQDNDQTGNVVVKDDSWVVLNDGFIEVRANSKLIIDNGGELHLNGGLLKVHDGGQVIVKEGGLLIYEAGTNIELNGNNAELALGGLVHVGDNATFGFTYQGTESGYIRLLNKGYHSERFSAGVNAEFQLEGEDKTDLILYMEEDVDLWEFEGTVIGQPFTSVNFDYIEFRNGRIQMEDDARIVLKEKSKFYNTRIERTDNLNDPRGIVHHRECRITNSDLDYIDIKSNLHYHDDGALIGVNSTFEHNQIDIRGYGFYLRDCYFKNSNISSFQTTIANNISKSIFDYNSGVYDESLTELTVFNTEFDHSNGLAKSLGRLTVKCSKFTNNYNAIIGNKGTEVNLSSLYNGGYNFFDNNDYNIVLLDAHGLLLEDGYNELYDGIVMNIDGTLDLPINPCPNAINADNNIWTPHSGPQPGYAYHPDYDEFELTIESFNQGAPPTIHCNIGFYFGRAEASIATCGEHDRPIKDDDGPKSDSDSLIVFPNITTPFYFENDPFDFAVKYTAYKTTIGDTIGGDDLLAADMYYELLAIAEMDSVSNDSLRAVIESMKWNCLGNYKATMERLISIGQILPEQNNSSFDVPVQQYVDVLMLFTDSIKTQENYHKQFQLELAKASLFRSIGKKNKALQILTNIDYCDHDSIQKIILDQQIQNIIFDIQAEANGPEFFLMDSVTFELDSSIFEIPLANLVDTTGFGSYIINPNTVFFSTCNLVPYQSSTTQGNVENLFFVVFPNPSQDYFFVSLFSGNIENTVELKMSLFNLSGKLVLQEQLNDFQSKIEVNHLPNSMYIYQISANDIPVQHGKISVSH